MFTGIRQWSGSGQFDNTSLEPSDVATWRPPWSCHLDVGNSSLDCGEGSAYVCVPTGKYLNCGDDSLHLVLVPGLNLSRLWFSLPHTNSSLVNCDLGNTTEYLCYWDDGFGPHPRPHYEWSFLFVLVFIVAGGVGNILVCLAVCLDRRLQNVTNYFLLSLAIADLLVSLFVMPLGAIPGFLGTNKAYCCNFSKGPLLNLLHYIRPFAGTGTKSIIEAGDWESECSFDMLTQLK
ncbi:hypothetical protein J6590_081991 [Homalodisca vitripennis]|nr:hypothetical protein J6590_081991 [Homalodisca vitripennis]